MGQSLEKSDLSKFVLGIYQALNKNCIYFFNCLICTVFCKFRIFALICFFVTFSTIYISGVCSVLDIVLNLGLFTNNSVAKPGYFVWSRRQTFKILNFFSPYFCNKSFEADDEKMLSGESHGQGFQKPEAILQKDPAPQHCI